MSSWRAATGLYLFTTERWYRPGAITGRGEIPSRGSAALRLAKARRQQLLNVQLTPHPLTAPQPTQSHRDAPAGATASRRCLAQIFIYVRCLMVSLRWRDPDFDRVVEAVLQ